MENDNSNLKSKTESTEPTPSIGQEASNPPNNLRQLRPQAQRVYKLNPGWKDNPLRRFPRNEKCPCRSGKKFKTCCLETLPLAVTDADAEIYERQLASSNLTFVTPANEAALRKDKNFDLYFANQDRAFTAKEQQKREPAKPAGVPTFQELRARMAQTEQQT